jgi:hypothetical protein
MPCRLQLLLFPRPVGRLLFAAAVGSSSSRPGVGAQYSPCGEEGHQWGAAAAVEGAHTSFLRGPPRLLPLLPLVVGGCWVRLAAIPGQLRLHAERPLSEDWG